ncbi:hypothetical protein LSAT2_001530 [Lamellibrachia satsuma]|nr:hypothetical protein LSAT2_001530 [Lamellibrachia satsuma]
MYWTRNPYITTNQDCMMVVSRSRSAVCLLLLGLMILGNDAWIFTDTLECAGKPYDTDTHICCDGHLHRNSEYWGRLSCCKAKAYNAKTHVCCDWDRVMPKEWVNGYGEECYGRRFTSNADS